MAAFEPILSGFPGLDRALDSIRLGDNVVWRVSCVDDFRYFVTPYVEQAIRDKRNLIYIRFAQHDPLVEERPEVKRYTLDPTEGFEPFTVSVHNIIEQEGFDAFYVFDCLSELQVAWAADLMMGNFFQVTCPFLFQLDTVAYFPVIRGRHSHDAIGRIRSTTQLLLDVYHTGDTYYIQPLKVWNRYSPTIFQPHRFDGDALTPLTDGHSVGRFYQIREEMPDTEQHLDSWERFFTFARIKYDQGILDDRCMADMCRMMITRDERMAELILQHFDAKDYFRVYKRMIGTGTIGGKSCGMLLARRMVQSAMPEFAEYFEPHDSFYIGSDVYYTYIVTNKCWEMRLLQKTDEGYFSVAQEFKERLFSGTFPPEVEQQFREMLEYFGQNPIIVRSSSLLEDSFGNAFAGKYESVFCVNSGSPEERLVEFEQAVRTVYASTMDPSALEYRRRRGLDTKDEQMAILVQRVSGSNFGDFFMPSAAGVGYSHSAYRWRQDIDPSAGMLRIVMGLGTRAVDRTDGDYPRLASLDRPDTTTLTTIAEKHRYSQHFVDILDLKSNRLSTVKLDQLLPSLPHWYQYRVLEHDFEAEDRLRQCGRYRPVCFANCQNLLSNRTFTRMMRKLLHVLQEGYQVPVDTEFTVNCSEDGGFSVCLLQCRPLNSGGQAQKVTLPQLEQTDILFHTRNASMGNSRCTQFDLVIQVNPHGYCNYPYAKKPNVARCIGQITHALAGQQKKILLLSPGRIGTSSPELGVPVSFADIAECSVLCEVSDSSAGYMPELSYGSHMFQDLVEADIFYSAVFETDQTLCYQPQLLQQFPDRFAEYAPEFADLSGIVRVYEVSNSRLTLWSEMLSGETLCGIAPA